MAGVRKFGLLALTAVFLAGACEADAAKAPKHRADTAKQASATVPPRLAKPRASRSHTGPRAAKTVPVQVQTAPEVAAEAPDKVSDDVPKAQGRSGTWIVTKTEWSADDEQGFQDFVRAIGLSGCTETAACLKVAANRYRDTDPKALKFLADCADFPYMLRAYYAWKNHLPFAYVDKTAGEGDEKFNDGNRTVSRRDLVDRGGGLHAVELLTQIHNGVWTGTYRTDASEKTVAWSDFYSPKIQQGSIHPGTAIYDVNGHVGIVYDIESDGRIDYMDAHPDFSVTRSTYGAQFGQSPMKLGGGIKNWRPIKLAGAKRQADGRLIGGKVVAAPNDQIADFSLEQYRGNVPGTEGDGENARFQYDGVEIGFFEYVRVAVSGGKMEYNPVYEVKATMRTLCNDLKDRALYVDMAIKDGLQKKAQPQKLPNNIYGADDLDWEMYSTPSRDARIKTAAATFYMDLQKMLFFWQQRDPRIVYDGLYLKEDLQKIYDEEAKACTITYTNSNGDPVTLGFDDIMNRLFRLDFDPYHCIERRWGATGDELSSCKDGDMKERWYTAEQHLRNQIDRTYDVYMGFSLSQLERNVLNSGADAPPQTDIKRLIASIGEQKRFAGMKPVGR
jgi:hypothetical protein